jgi:hypothetical protein
MATKHFKVLRSHEEIERLNVEVHRLQAWADFNDNTIRSSVDKLKLDGSTYLTAAMENFYAERHRVNDIHRARLQEIYALDGFSGMHPSGSDAVAAAEVEDEDEEDTSNDEALHLTDCLERLS